MVREVDPPRPSTKLSTADGLPSIAANRDVEPAQAEAGVAGRTRLGRDEGAGEGPHAAVRDGQRLRGRHPAVPGRRAGGGRAAQPGLPAAEVRPQTPRRGDRSHGGRPGALDRHCRDDPGLDRSQAAGTRGQAAGARGQAAGARGQAAGADRTRRDGRKGKGPISRGESAREAVDLATKEAKAHEEADKRAEQLAREDYVNRVNRAYREVQDDNIALAEDLLHGCPPERRGWEWHFVERLCNADRLSIDLGNESVNALAFSPDGTWVVSGAGYCDFRRGPHPTKSSIDVWDVSSGRRRKTLLGAKGTVYTVAVSPDGKKVAAGCGQFYQAAGLVLVWDVETGQSTWTRSEPGLNAMSVAFSPDGKSLAVGYGAYSGAAGRASEGLGRGVRNGDQSVHRSPWGSERGRVPSRRKTARRRGLGSRGGLGSRNRPQASRPQGSQEMGLLRGLTAPTGNGWPPAGGTGP